MENQPLTFKVATEDWEFDLIHQMNYKTFVEEIPQHQGAGVPRLVDKFHAENTYLIALSGRRLAGMICTRGNRPFSLDLKLPNLDSFLPPNRAVCEIRLLAVDKKFRTGQVFQGLMALVWQYFVEHGFDLGIISGTTRQAKLYHHVGFIPFGPLVGTEKALFQPMYLSIESFEAGAREFLSARSPRHLQQTTVNFLPGPVTVSRQVRRAFEQGAESHRSDSFLNEFEATRKLLRELTGARCVEILLGSGTLANDTIAAQLSLENQPGLVISNGEFGERLADQAHRFELDYAQIQYAWGQPFDLEAIRQRVRAEKPAWLWCVHCETSTGVLNDLDALKALCAETGTKLCLDCISSIGTIPVNLEGVWFASCASGKGLRSFPGLSMVFHHHDLPQTPARIPRYLDLAYYARHRGIAFTQSSNLIHALQAAIKPVDWKRRFAEVAETSVWLRSRLEALGFKLTGAEAVVSPAVVTIDLPPDRNSTRVGAELREAGFLVSCNSDYLRGKNWIQVCLMGEFNREKLVALLNHLNRICFRRSRTETPAPSPAAVTKPAGS